MRGRVIPALFLLAALLGFESVRSSSPNILLIVSDDQGYADLGILNEEIITPNLDRIAREGSRLTSFYVAWPACTPSRGAFLSGRYSQRNGIYDMIRNEAPDYGHKYDPETYAITWERIGGMDAREILIPETLKARGYVSGIFGKWDLGISTRFLPLAKGFDEFYGLVNTGIDYYTHERYGVHSMYRNNERTEEDKGIYATYLFEREALRFLEERSDEEPFFLYVPFNAPHSSSALDPKIRGTVQVPPEFEAMYPPLENPYRMGSRYGKETLVPTPEKRKRDFRAATTCMDASIGKLLDALDRKGIAEKTIVIFFADNGGGGGADNGVLRGKKGDTWEGGVRVLSMVRWPAGGVPAGVENDAFLTSLELMPSLAAATGASLPEGVTLDGYNWWPTLRGESESPRQEMFWKRRHLKGARVGDWKWVDMGEGQGGLFNLSEDIGERRDSSNEHPEELARLKRRYEKWYYETMVAAEPRGPFKDY